MVKIFSKDSISRIKKSRRIRISIILVGAVLIALMFPRGEALEFDVAVGSIWIQDDLIATMPFEILKDPETYRIEKLKASESVLPVFEIDRNIQKSVSDSIIIFNKRLLSEIDKQIEQNIDGKNIGFLSIESFNKIKEIRKYENSLSVSYPITTAKLFSNIINITEEVYRKDFFNLNYSEIEKDTIALRDGKFENLIPKGKILDRNANDRRLNSLISSTLPDDPALMAIYFEYSQYFFKPSVRFSKELSELEIKIAQDRVSRNVGIVEEDERIVAKHNRITPDIKLKIDSYRIARGEERGFWSKLLQGIGKVLHVLVIITLFSVYIFLFRPKIFNDNSKVFLITVIIVLISFIAFLINQINVNAPIELLILVPVVSMLVTIFFDSRIGFYATIVIALIVGGLRGNDYSLTVMNVVAGGLAAYTVRDIKNRNQIFRSFLFILLGYMVSILAFGLERFAPWEEIAVQIGFAASNALFSPVLTYGLIIFFEKLFKITTDITLLELTDFNNPLLKELARNAQGTFNHSLTMGNMVESAAAEIGANPLLVRVGALYHDIGKSQNPSAFVENQIDNYNIHDQLTTEQSAQMIIEHVTQGVTMAQEYNLPQEIIEFITTHHGTLLVSFFYDKAAEEKGIENVDVNKYRYPGPKPTKKETALLMLADACESAVRAMAEPTPEKIENIVSNIISSRLKDEQLEESPLTFSDLTKIRKSFYATLVALHHKRIRYPKQDEMENEIKEDSDQ
ncbi:MAG: HDIG domain-containing protein [Ignavibacteriae bacterium]|nr:HDIG domain-containing protein [Ignavibacteriota bacterium]